MLRMKQVHILTKILGLALICVGDFNVTKDELIQSGWPNFMNCDIILPQGATTTLKGTSGRLIDYLLISRSIVAMLKSLEIDASIPTTPHFALKLVLHAKPRSLMEPVLVHPRPLPISTFMAEWKVLSTRTSGYCYKLEVAYCCSVLR